MTKQNESTVANSGQPRDRFVAVAANAFKAESAIGDALRGALAFAAENGKFEPLELETAGYSAGTAKVYASEWNQAAAAAAIIGKARTVKLLSDRKALEATGEPKEYRAMLAVLRAVKAQGKADGIKGEATTRQASAIVKALPQVVATRHANATEKAPRKPRQPTGADKATLAALAATSLSPSDVFHAVRLAANNASRLAEPEGKEAAWRTAMAKLQDACEALSTFK